MGSKGACVMIFPQSHPLMAEELQGAPDHLLGPSVTNVLRGSPDVLEGPRVEESSPAASYQLPVCCLCAGV